ncbi:MAG: alpha/beta hydrolase fold domain-containing protein [Dehalococcoidia bacterium]
MPVHPQVQALIEVAAAAPPVWELPPEEARRLARERDALTARTVPPLAREEDLAIPGPAGTILGRLYDPAPADRLPLLVYLHGGGWVVGDRLSNAAMLRRLAVEAPCRIVSVDYRLSPEHRFPAAVDDSVAATRYFLEREPVVAVGGASAGGALAAAVAIALRDTDGPKLAAQWLLYPVTDYGFDTESYREKGEGYGLSRQGMEFYWSCYLERPGDGLAASPLRVPDLAGLPPAIVMTAEFDPLRDDGRLYAHRLNAAGVPVVLRDYAGMHHGFAVQIGLVDDAAKAVSDAAAELRQNFAASSQPSGGVR